MGKPWENAAASSSGKMPPWEQAKKRPSGLQRAWDAMAVPEQMSREGLKMMTDAIPEAPITGNMAADVAMGAPKIMVDTIAEAAPGFISRGSIATAGALKGIKMAAPVIKAVGGAVGRAAEGVSGLEYKTPGVLAAAAKDPTLIFGKGKEAAGKAYEAIKDNLQVRPSFLEATTHAELLQDAKAALDAGTLSAQEALIARRTVDAARKSMPVASANYLRGRFDEIAKTLSAEADAGFRRAIQSDALRTIFAVNKTGGTSIAKNILGTIAGGIPAIAMSPLVQGAVATGLGAGAKAIAPFANQALGSGSAIGGTNAALAALRARRKE